MRISSEGLKRQKARKAKKKNRGTDLKKGRSTFSRGRDTKRGPHQADEG